MSEMQTEMADGVPVAPAKKKPRGKPFQKGWKGGPGRGHTANPVEFSGSFLFADLNAAYNGVPSDADTPGVKAARKLLKEDYGKFAMIWAKAFEAQAREQVAAAAGQPQVAAAATEREGRVEELIERLLGEWEREEGRGT